MKDSTRVAVAYIAGRLISGQDSSSIYDYGVSKHFSFSGNVRGNDVSVYDHTLNCHITGFGVGTSISLFHYGNHKHITLEIKGNQFSGYDYDSGKHFSGTVSGNSISLYDYETGGYRQYTI
jgi:hypothetical protein